MKALAASALLIALLSVAEPVGAHHFVFFGPLAADQPYTLHVDNAQIGATTMVTVYYFIGGRPATAEREPRLGKAKVDVVQVGPNAREQFVQVIPKGTRAISMHVTAPANGTLIVDVRQGATTYSDTFSGGGMLAFDVQ